MLNLKELMDIGCVQTVVDSDGWMYPCGKNIVAIRRWPDEGDGESFGGVCQQHAKQAGAELVPLKKHSPNPGVRQKGKRMTVNVTQKDKALQEVIDWCKQLEIEGVKLSDALLGRHEIEAYSVVVAQIKVYGAVIDHCRSMLGSGSMPSCFTYEDIDDSSPDIQPQVGDYGLAIRENAHGQEEIPFHIEREERTGLPVALLNDRLYAKPEDDIDDGQYVSLFQLYLDGFLLSRTGRKLNENE